MVFDGFWQLMVFDNYHFSQRSKKVGINRSKWKMNTQVATTKTISAGGIASPATSISLSPDIWVTGLITKYDGEAACPYEVKWDTQSSPILHRKSTVEVAQLVANFQHCKSFTSKIRRFGLIVGTGSCNSTGSCFRKTRQTFFEVWFGTSVRPYYEQIQNYVPVGHLVVEKWGRGPGS